MRRRLLLLRHAKAAAPGGAADRDRPLARRGREATPLIAEYLAKEGLRPDLALVSPARRTRETWDLLRPALEDVPVRLEERIYEATAQRLLATLREIEAPVRTALVVGHNPGLGDLVRGLAGDGEAEAMDRLSGNFPTAALAVLDFALESWRDLAPGTGRLERLVTPKSLGGAEARASAPRTSA